MNAFELLSEWPVDNVAAGVLAPDGTTRVHGDAARPFALASVTKPLAAMAVMVAVEEGVVDLDTPVGPPGVTVRHLLAHAGGLAPDQRRLMTEPGGRRIYSNAGFEVLADGVADAAEIDFTTYFTEAIVDGLGLTGTVLNGSPAHGATSTVDDLLVVARELLGDAPRVLAPSTIEQMRTPVFPELAGVLPGLGVQDPNPWGLGCEIRGVKRPHWTGVHNSPETFGHFGRAGTFLWIDPVQRVACVVLTDREFGDWTFDRWPAFSDAVLSDVTRSLSTTTVTEL